MPHQCTNCGHVFDDGSKEMLSGCPDCGGNKFQYHPGNVPDEPPAEAEPPERESGSVTGAVGRAANKVRDAVSSDSPQGDRTRTSPEASPDPAIDAGSDGETDAADGSSDVEVSEAETTPETTHSSDEPTDDAEVSVDSKPTDAEDSAQADARTSVVDRDVLPDTSEGRPDTSEGRVVKEPDDEDRPDLEALRAELNDQFESIRIVAPGQYELNLMELYDRQEYIIALQEDGQYVIEVPDAWEMDDE